MKKRGSHVITASKSVSLITKPISALPHQRFRKC